ncbi:NAD(P)-binding protein [Luminiphilus sp. nBUS_16]|uniref:NAD(P)/FAD-dependent oxidoreductase n=1 Tax=Luminiphilus sp. nBUS_16 TaxID=3395315 RepID=UPI003EC10C0B
MTRKTDKQLGMHRSITRRDFVQGSSLAVLGAVTSGAASVTATATAEAASALTAGSYYPPTKTGMRGSHNGAYEVAHALARQGASFDNPEATGEEYDLVVVGAGISGLAAAHYYRERFGDDTRILLLDNHDDFGGHAKRNEFHQGGGMVLSLGGTHNLEWWQFSDDVKAFMKTFGVDVEAMRNNMDFSYGQDAPNSPAMWFDESTYGVNRLVANVDFNQQLSPEIIDQFPISEAGRQSLKSFYGRRDNVFADLSDDETDELLSSISYPDFLRQYGGLTEDALQLFDKKEHGAWGIEMRALSANDALWDDNPGLHLMGEDWSYDGRDYPAALWPDGNASLVRLMVARLLPHVAPNVTPDNVALAAFNYAALDEPERAVRVRLNATVVNTVNTETGARITYVENGKLKEINAKHAVLACYHSVIPHLCSSLPEPQKDALKYQVKIPLILTNVLIRNTDALDKLGVDGISCPGRLHARLFLFKGINNGGYEHPMEDSGPVSLVFWGAISPPEDAVDLKSQLRASRKKLLAMSFEDFEREVRTVLDDLLGPAGFDVNEDLLAITVNRWPHGYSYEYMDLWDPDWAEGEAPHEIARQTFGAIAIANSDAGASAYTHVAIDEAYRAIGELPHNSETT